MTPPPSSTLARRVEEACFNGWPPLTQLVLDGWLVCRSEGYTRRANAVHPFHPGLRDLDDKIGACERLYEAQGLPTIFCIRSTTAPDLGAALDRRGYRPPEDETRVLYRDLAERGSDFASLKVEGTETRPSESWLDTLARLQGQDDRTRAVHRRILEGLSIPAVFVAVPAEEGRTAALAFGAVHEGVVCINSVITAPDFRRRGYAQEAIAAVMAWARQRAGATGACIPVVAGNAAAVALYEGLGFGQEVFRYHYRRKG